MTLTQQQRAQLLEMHRAGLKPADIAAEVGWPVHWIEHAIGLALALEKKPARKREWQPRRGRR